ncbi:hypothetical protein SAMN02745136_00457 [Anaerocolumna jejuensis DSM 15929]|uniref:Uncharacterized protein n=1 Tax=Anaerocolumna jejuensis DSM 15929 TaxID=1121322 RepID=A0A1M6KHT3_9FIRM|nr:hypothetical protein [Anaerocolumna jejuensis]SHJ58475.1 hypothetical protein SAMN02745136_00457 [Anaerocolumna jejuensis DSM 15929]
MKYTINKGTEGIQEVLVRAKEYKLSRYIRVTECKLVNLLTLVNYLVRVEYELVEDTEIIVNLTVNANYKDKFLPKPIRVIENDYLNIMDLLRLPEDVLPFVTALLLDNNEDCTDLFSTLLSAYAYSVRNGAQPKVSDLVGLQTILTVSNQAKQHLAELDEAIAEIVIKMI